MPLKKGDRGPEIIALQKSLTKRGYPVEPDGIFGPHTYRAVRAFQSQNLDQNGQPLVIDGIVGPLTWWSLNHPKPAIDVPSAVDYLKMPSHALGGSRLGREALQSGINEIKAGAGEMGGNNRGPFVRKYLNGLAQEGDNWCAGFVSWCFSPTTCGERLVPTAVEGGRITAVRRRGPFKYSVSARNLLNQFKGKGWAHVPGSGYQPPPGDIVVWWRERADGWLGHVGLVHQIKDGMLYTIEGNKSPKVRGFSYVFSRMDKLLGFGHVPD